MLFPGKNEERRAEHCDLLVLDILWTRLECLFVHEYAFRFFETLQQRHSFVSVGWIVFGLCKSYGIEDVYKIRLDELSGMFITILDDSYLLFTFVLATLITPITFRHFCTYFRCLNKVSTCIKYNLRVVK